MKKANYIVKTAPRIFEKTAKFYRGKFNSLNAGLEYVLEAFPELYAHTIRNLKGRFDRGELMLMIDIMSGTLLMPWHMRWSLPANVEDGIALEHYDQKWEIDGDTLKTKLASLTIFESTCLEIWIQGFWNQTDHSNIEEYVAALSEAK